jgi:hypothetical protein
VAVAASVLGVGSLTDNAPSKVAVQMTPTTSITASTAVTSQTQPGETAQTARAEFWAGKLVWWVETIDAGGFREGRTAKVVDFWETADPIADVGSLVAKVEQTETRLTFLANFQTFAPGEYQDDAAWQLQVADSTAEGATTNVGTIFMVDEQTVSDSQGSPATIFYTEVKDGSRLVTVVSPIGLLILDVDPADSSQFPGLDQLKAIAIGMTGTAYDLVLHPDEPLPAVEPEQLPGPKDGEWIQLDTDVWVANVAEDNGSGPETRIWVKTDTQDPTPASSTDTRSLLARAGDSDLIVIVVDISGEQRPEIVTAQWSDGTSESDEMVWNEELGLGLARLEWRDGAELETIDGP